MHSNINTIALSVLILCPIAILAKPCNASFGVKCQDGSVFEPQQVGSVNGCVENACSGRRGGIKHLYGITNGDNCLSFTAYGSTDCSASYSSTTTQCNRGQAGLTSGDAQWYSYRVHCKNNY